MRIIVDKSVAADQVVQADEVQATPETVAQSLGAGFGLGPVRDGTATKAPFISADWAFVEVEGSTEHIEHLIGFPFTGANASAACLAPRGAGVRCVLGFVLPTQVCNVGDFRALTAGLAVVYDIAVPKDCLATVRMVDGGEATTLPGSLSGHALEMLLALGKEELHRRQYRTNGTIRSEVRLPRDAVLTLAEGEAAELQALATGTPVRCPVHADFAGTAEVIRHGNHHGVLCMACGRSYWSGYGRSGYDFAQFKRGFEELLAQQQAEIGDSINPDRPFIKLRQRYLPPLVLKPGYTLVKSPKGSGKTEALAALVAQCKAEGKRILLVGHRRSLLANLAARLKLTLYYTADGDEAGRDVEAGVGTTISRKLLSHDSTLPSMTLAEFDPTGTGYFAICLDSIPHRLNPAHQRYEVVIIDESEQVVQHLVSNTLKRARRDAFLKLRHYLTFAESVYLLDADLDLVTWSMVCAAIEGGARTNRRCMHVAPVPAIRFVVNEPICTEHTFEMMRTQDGLMTAIIDAVKAGGKTYIACNSRKGVEKIAAYLRSTFPEKRITDITSVNSQDPEVRQLMLDLAGEYDRGLDVLVVSPAVGTGIDISFDSGRCGVQHVFGMFLGNIVTHFDIDQQLCRVRNPGSVKVWIDSTHQQYETSPEVIMRELQRTVLRTDLITGYDRAGQPVFSPSDEVMVRLWAMIVAMQRASKNRLRSLFSELRAENGWRAEVTVESEDDMKRGKAALTAGGEQREAERVTRILEAPDITQETADALIERVRDSEPVTQEERAMLERYWLAAFYVAPVNATLIELDHEGRMRTKIMLLELLYRENDLLKGHDRHEIETEFMIAPRYYLGAKQGQEWRLANNHVRKNSSHVPFDRSFRSTKAALLSELLAAAAVFDPATREFLLDADITSARLGAFVALFRSERKRIESELDLVMHRDIDAKPTQQLGAVLRALGLSQKMVAERKVGSTKERIYRLDGDQLRRVLEVVVRREQRSRLRHGRGPDELPDGADRPVDTADESATADIDAVAFGAAIGRLNERAASRKLAMGQPG